VREKVKTDNMQFAYMGGKETTDVISIIKKSQETYIAKKKEL